MRVRKLRNEGVESTQAGKLCGREIRYGKSGRSVVLYCSVNEGRVAKKVQMPERAALSLSFPCSCNAFRPWTVL